MPEKTIEDILLKIKDQSAYGDINGYRQDIAKASSAIRQLIKEELEKRLPNKLKEKQCSCGNFDAGENIICSCGAFQENYKVKGFNFALTLCKAAIAEYLGEGER